MGWVDEARLDDVEALAALDSRDTLRSLAQAGAQVRRSLVSAEEAGIARVAGGERPRSVLVAALGGSAVVGDVLDCLTDPGSPVPVMLRADGPLPGWVGPLDLVVAVSQSGRAAGPLALAAEAGRRGASLLTVGAADSPLADVTARARGVHVEVALPAPSSRTALWSLLVPVLVAADRLGLADAPDDALQRVARVLDEVAEECRPSSDAFVNPAKVLATSLDGTVPVVLGDGALTGVAACRAAQMLSRTARVPATHGRLPDAASAAVAALDGPFAAGLGARDGGGAGGGRDIFADPYLDGPAMPRLGLLVLRDPTLDPAAAGLADAVVASAEDAGAVVLQQEARAGHPLERLASLVALTDFAATYLALGLGFDPSVSRHVTDLRDRTS
ncbi:phosphosugar isomerase [Phycicoccus jejuensis]|uniref:SIS domain-containing protein n=1 Tax=Phycicoccus TaxID=367298 RepID=UPI0004C30398|nr:MULTISPECIES: SIS domain-containing protein [Phycicoccus]GIL35535.1 bifunctional glucose-6-phosphate/mannose-6-phosphate isomerase [Phycicoccus sp. DTK01]